MTHTAENDAPLTVTTLLHSRSPLTGMCRCGGGPFVPGEWLAHYQAQDEPHTTRVIPPDLEGVSGE